jgi:hypothetical protein
MVCLHDQIFPSNFICPPVSNKKVDKTKHLSISLPIFDGPIRHVWRHVHTIEIVFETCAQVNLKENFDV